MKHGLRLELVLNTEHFESSHKTGAIDMMFNLMSPNFDKEKDMIKFMR